MWQKFTTLKPPEYGKYFWRGKSGYMGCDYYYTETETFDFSPDTPTNKVADDELYWLDETNIPYGN